MSSTPYTPVGGIQAGEFDYDYYDDAHGRRRSAREAEERARMSAAG